MFLFVQNLVRSSVEFNHILRTEHRHLLAIMVLLLGVVLLGIMGVFVKHLGQSYSPTLLAVARNIFGFIPIFLMLIPASKDTRIFLLMSKRYMILVFFRGSSIAFAQFCFYLALVKLEFATASTLIFAGPLFLTALSIPILKASVGIWRWSAVIIGFIGIVLIMGIGSDLFSIYSFLPLGAAFGYALSSVTVKLFPTELQTAQIQFYTQIVTLFSASILLIIFSGYTPIISVIDFLLLATMGMMGGCGVICLISAYRMTEPVIIAPFEYFGIPLSIYLGWAVFNEFPISKLFPGVLFIILAGIIIIWREEKNKQVSK